MRFEVTSGSATPGAGEYICLSRTTARFHEFPLLAWKCCCGSSTTYTGPRYHFHSAPCRPPAVKLLCASTSQHQPCICYSVINDTPIKAFAGTLNLVSEGTERPECNTMSTSGKPQNCSSSIDKQTSPVRQSKPHACRSVAVTLPRIHCLRTTVPSFKYNLQYH